MLGRRLICGKWYMSVNRLIRGLMGLWDNGLICGVRGLYAYMWGKRLICERLIFGIRAIYVVYGA